MQDSSNTNTCHKADVVTIDARHDNAARVLVHNRLRGFWVVPTGMKNRCVNRMSAIRSHLFL